MATLKRFDQFVNENSDNIDHEAHHEAENYMFFGNLETIKRACEELLAMDPAQVDELLKNGHNWAADHVATSKDDIEEVLGFFKNEMSEPERSGYSDEEMDQITKDQMEHDEMMLRREQGI